MTGAALIFCVWLIAPTQFDVVLVSMGLMEPPPCRLNSIDAVSYAECRKMLPLVLRRLRDQYPAVNGGCRS